jgi:hypothetical protein
LGIRGVDNSLKYSFNKLAITLMSWYFDNLGFLFSSNASCKPFTCPNVPDFLYMPSTDKPKLLYMSVNYIYHYKSCDIM